MCAQELRSQLLTYSAILPAQNTAQTMLSNPQAEQHILQVVWRVGVGGVHSFSELLDAHTQIQEFGCNGYKVAGCCAALGRWHCQLSTSA
jgi:hypothetical protein